MKRCKYEQVFTDYVPYGATNVPMVTSVCACIEGDEHLDPNVQKGIEEYDDCNEGCPGFEERSQYDEEGDY